MPGVNMTMDPKEMGVSEPVDLEFDTAALEELKAAIRNRGH